MKKNLALFLLVGFSISSRSQSLQDSLQLEAFIDGIMRAHLDDQHIAGGTISIVSNGKVILAKGYGFADLKTRRPVKPDSTLFRIGSISKMFTWISVMELVSQGKLKLDEDINHYLKDFKIPDTYPQPITLKNLMTHTPGFEDVVIGLFSKDSTSMRPLGTVLAREIPARVRPPGTFASYSNHGVGMAGYIVEQTAGKSFNDYVENSILIPLRMNTTTFRQPLPRFLKPMMSKGYKYVDNNWEEQKFEFVPLYPVGGASASAHDMANFMLAILNNGKYFGNSILDSTSLHFMETPAHRHHPAVNPMRYGFIDMSRNGFEVIGHGGDTFWFHSMMALFPESNTGLFVSFNTDSGGGSSGKVVEEFMDRYYPEKNPLMPARKVMASRLNRFAGAYRVNRYAYKDITAVGSMLNDVHVNVVDSSRLKLSGFGTVQYYVPVDTLTFREEHTSQVIAFKQNQQGEVTQLFLGNLPILALDKTHFVNGADLHKGILLTVLVITIVVLFYWPIAGRARKGYETMGSIMLLPIGAKITAWINYFLLLAFYVGLVASLSDPFEIVYGVPTSLKAVLVIPFLIIFVTLIMFLQLYRILGQRRYQGWSQFFYFLITLVSIAALWQMWYWNFIGFNYR